MSDTLGKNRSAQKKVSPWRLMLFVSQGSAASASAVVELRRIAAEYLPKNSVVEIIDVYEDPEAAEREQILAVPTLVRKQPIPVRRIIGDLSNIPRVLTSIGFSSVHLDLAAEG